MNRSRPSAAGTCGLVAIDTLAATVATVFVLGRPPVADGAPARGAA